MVHLSIRGLTKSFGKQTVLNGIHLEIPAGELFFLLGPSGCGKTTLLRHVAGFLQPDAGGIYFDDQDVTRIPPHRRGLGMMFQSYALWPHLNVAQNVAFGLEERRRPREEIEERVAQMLALVQLGDLGARRISELSGGQQQRVALARALVVQPRCLLLDEPLSNLDARLRHEMRSEIRRLCKSLGLTAIYVTHDRDEALSMADRVAIMESGRLVQVGAPEEVYRHPGSAMVAEFLGDTNFIQGVAQGLSSREGYYAVQTHVGIMSARPNLADWNPTQGEHVILSVRPETFSFGHILGASNSFTGNIIETTYLGASVQYLFQVYNGPVLKVSESNPQRIRQPSAEAVRVSVSAADAVMIQH